MFSFFRKDKGDKKPVVPETAPVVEKPMQPKAAGKPAPSASGTPTAAPALQMLESADKQPGPGLQIHESEVLLTPEAEEAVMFYASGRTGDATATLNRYILNHPDTRDPLPWQLLFDIYEASGQRKPFEDLALDFAVRFERSPPTWRTLQTTVAAAAGNNHPTFAFGASLSPQDKARLDHFMQESASAETVVIDFSKTSVPDSDTYATAIRDCLSRLVASGKTIRLPGMEAFVVRLNAYRADDRLSEPLWLLLLLLLQLQGKEAEFEVAAVDYAVRFEISPPSYAPPKHVDTADEPASDINNPSGHRFPMQGQIDAGSATIFQKLNEFAAPLDSVEIDLGQVTRIDFTVIGLLMDTVMNLTNANKNVTFHDGNEMVCLLLQMVGVGQFAGIQPKVRK